MTRAQLQPFIDARYISVQKHPTDDLYIFNYTQQTQFEQHWTEETMACRGLILDGQDRLVSRPFKKFKNLEEYGPDWTPPAEPFEVTMKLDGSLGITYLRPNGEIHIATRGSFTSEQALHATHLFEERYSALPWEADRYTYLFEIIYPTNRIVVDYGDLDDLILLAIIDTQTGHDVPLPAWFPNHVTTYDGITDLSRLKGMAKDNEEGFVVRFASGLRLKVKFDEYVRLHRLVTGVNARRIWEILAHGGTIDELIQRVPEEFETWVRQTAEDIWIRFREIVDEAEKDYFFQCKEGSEDRKSFALAATKTKYPSIMFAMYDRKPYSHIIWKLIKPAAERPFKQADE
jgi:RNA ligase